MHISVLKKEVTESFAYLKNKEAVFVDGTAGLAGHSVEIISKISNKIKILAIDKDKEIIALAKKKVSDLGLDDNITFIHNDFSNIKSILSELKLSNISGALLDLGVSSFQIDHHERGFSFKYSQAPLDMRMDQEQQKTAYDIVNFYSERELSKVIKEFGEEPYASKIAREIAEVRTRNKIKTVGELVAIINTAIPKKVQFRRGHNAATKTFQALRIETNLELEKLKGSIVDFVECLEKGARIAVISFHSLEDRIIKQTFSELENPCSCPTEIPFCVCGKKPQIKIINKKPIIASLEELESNTRSRSAKLRVAEKL